MRTKSALLALALLAPLLVAAPARASFPGDNGRLAYIRAEDGAFDLVTMDAMNIADKEVVLDNFYAMPALAWGPEGTLAVVLQRTETDPLGLYSVDHETGAIELITTAVTGRFSWSPDGDAVVTTIPNPNGSGNLHLGVVDVATGAVTDLGVEGLDASWAPDGSWIAYTDWQGSNENGDVWLIRPNGGEAHNFTNTPDDDEEGMIDWSPDATEIMVGVTVEPFGKPIRPAHQQHRIDIETGARTQVTVLSMNTNMPAWSPNGNWLVYQASDWWGFGSIQYGLFLRHVDATTGEEPTYAIVDQEAVVGVSWQSDPGCLLGSSAAAPLSAGAASEPEVKFGSWVAQGCFTKKGSVYKTKDEMQLSGVTLKPTKGSISIDTDTGRLTSSHEVLVSIEGRVEGVKIGPIQLDKGVLALNLREPLRFKLQHFLELPVQDVVIVKPTGNGKSDLLIALVYPQLFGLGVVSQVVGLRNGLGMEKTIRFEAPGPVHVTDLLQLNNLVIEYNPSTKDWATRASIAGLGTSADIDFRHQDGKLVTAHVGVPTLSLAGLIELTDFRIEFDESTNEKKEKVETYRITATTKTEVEGGTDSVTGQATYIDGALDSFDVRLGLAHIWGVVRIQGFNLEWSKKDGWSGGGAAVLKNESTTIGAEMEIQLRSKKHKLIGGSINAPLILLGARPKQSFQLEQVNFSYTNQVLPDGKPEEKWSGGAKVRLPGEEAPAVGGSFTFTNGAFTAGSVNAENIPLGPALKFRLISAGLGLTPLSMQGSATVQLGPEIPLLGAATIGGTASYTAAADPKKADIYTFGGSLDVGNANLIGANVTYLTSGVVAASGNVSWRIGDLSLAEGTLNGYFDEKEFLLSGNATVGIGTHKVGGESRLNKQGVAGCVGLPNTPLKFGFGYLWTGEKRRFQGVCDIAKFLASPTPPGVSGAAAAAAMPAGLDGVVFEIKGDGGPPIVTLEGPGGESVVVPASGEDGFVGGSFVFTDDESDATYVVVPSPSAGAWTVEEGSGSVPVTGLRTAEPMPEMNITGSVAAGDPYVLTYSAEGIGGQDVQFVERWADGEMPLGEGSAPGGTLEFDPSPGSAGERSIVAIVTQDGLVRDEVEVATYETGEIAPSCTTEAPCMTSTSMKLKRRGTKVVLSGAVTPAPAGGSVKLLIERKRGKSWTTVASTTERPSAGGTYKGSLKPKGSGKCRATATYLGTSMNEASAVSKSFACAPGNSPGKLPLL